MRGLRLLALGALLLAGCGGDGSGGEAADGDVPAAGTAADSAAGANLDSTPDSLVDPGTGTAAAVEGAGPGGSAPRDDRPLRSRLLRLVNGRDEEMVVHAAAGAGWVPLDTVAAGDSTVVNVESRARRVRLRASGARDSTAADGAARGEVEGEVDLAGSGTARWLIPPPPDPDSLPAADPGDGSGVGPGAARVRALSSR